MAREADLESSGEERDSVEPDTFSLSLSSRCFNAPLYGSCAGPMRRLPWILATLATALLSQPAEALSVSAAQAIAQTTPPFNPAGSSSGPSLRGQVLQVRSTADGLFVKTEGWIDNLRLERSGDRRRIELVVPNAQLRGAIRLPTQAELYRLGIESMAAVTLPPRDSRPATTKITLNVPADAVDWRASRSGESGIVLLPTEPPKPIRAASRPGSPGSPGNPGSPGSSGSLGRPGNRDIPVQAPSRGNLPPGAELITVTLPPGSLPGPLPGSRPSWDRPTWTPPITQGRPLIVIDPGHGGPDPGAVGRGGLRETDINLEIARKLSQRLEAAGIATLMTRTGEYDLDLPPRVAMAERANATMFVSIHSNAINMSRPDVNGVETYYYSSGQTLANVIHRNIINRTNSSDRGVRRARFYVLKQTSMPAVLIETGFVTGAQDAIKLANSTFRSQMATAIAAGIQEYLGR